jgi:hypothetical protein
MSLINPDFDYEKSVKEMTVLLFSKPTGVPKIVKVDGNR